LDLQIGTGTRILEKKAGSYLSVFNWKRWLIQWHPVVRYDCAHGFAHRDLMQKNGEVIKTPVFIHDYNDALTFAESDLKANWKVYKERYLRE
jgi:hypothetical protein